MCSFFACKLSIAFHLYRKESGIPVSRSWHCARGAAGLVGAHGRAGVRLKRTTAMCINMISCHSVRLETHEVLPIEVLELCSPQLAQAELIVVTFVGALPELTVLPKGRACTAQSGNESGWGARAAATAANCPGAWQTVAGMCAVATSASTVPSVKL